MEVVKLTSGLLAHLLTEREQNVLWAELSKDISTIGKNIELFTPRDNKGYYIVSETELKYDSYESVIKANGKTIKVKYNICNQTEKTYKAVRGAYEIRK
jgi:carbonic anhydrase